MQTKALPVKVKATDDETGIVEAIVATYDRDSSGDRIVPGAFADSLADWAKSAEAGAPMPYIFSHRHDDIDAYLGEVLDAKELDGEGLWIKAQHDMDDPMSRKTYRQLKSGRIRQWSFAYEAESSPDEESHDNLLSKIKIYEVGPTLIGMNQNTRTLSAKGMPSPRELAYALRDVNALYGAAAERKAVDAEAARTAVDSIAGAVTALRTALSEDDAPPDDGESADDPDAEKAAVHTGQKAGRVLSAKNETSLRSAADAIAAALDGIKTVLSTLGQDDDQGKTAPPDGPAKDETARGKSEEPTQTGSAVESLALQIQLAEGMGA